MKSKLVILLATLSLSTCLRPALAQLTIPSDGSDGVFAPTADTIVDLSQAVTGHWDDNNTANAGKGIYDPDKWAIVFKYSSINIPGVRDTNSNVVGVAITFRNHPSRAPVVWLVRGDVTIDGLLNLNGESKFRGPDALQPGEPGPGGFRGGVEGPQGLGAGLGPGGGGEEAEYAKFYGNP